MKIFGEIIKNRLEDTKEGWKLNENGEKRLVTEVEIVLTSFDRN